MSNIFNNIRLTRNNILVKEEAQSLLLRDNVSEHPSNTGVVLAMSPTVQINYKLRANERVFFSKYAGVYIYLNEERYLLLSINECFGTLTHDILKDEFCIGETTDMIAYAEKLQSKYMKTGNNLNITNVLY